VRLKAELPESSTFVGWGGPCGDALDCVFTIEEDTEVVLNLGILRHRVHIDTEHLHGEIVSEPLGIHCPPNCETYVDHGTSIQLRATPDSQHNFSHWAFGPPEGCFLLEDGCRFTVEQDWTLYPYFYASGGQPQWAIEGEGEGQHSAVGIVATDDGGSIVVGDFNQTLGLCPSTPLSAIGSRDMYVARLDVSGTCLWAKSFGSAGSDHVTSVATRPNGGAVIVGQMAEDLTFEGSTLTARGGGDAFALALDANGNLDWMHVYGDDKEQTMSNVSVANDGSIAVSGMFYGDWLSDVVLHSAPFQAQQLVLVLNPNGEVQWSRDFPALPFSPVSDRLTDRLPPHVAFSDEGLFVSSIFRGPTIDLGQGHQTANSQSSFVARYEPDSGQLVWGQLHEGLVGDMVVNAYNEVFLATIIGHEILIGGESHTTYFVTTVLEALAQDDGSSHWLQKLPISSKNDESSLNFVHLATGPLGNVALVGEMDRGGELGGGWMGGFDSPTVVARYTRLGEHLWSHSWRETRKFMQVDFHGSAIAISSYGDVLFAGRVEEELQLGDIALHTSEGSEVFVASLSR
jgi:hypothetical protein